MNILPGWKDASKYVPLVLSFLFFTLTAYGQCPSGEVPVDIQITADANAGSDNTRWELLNGTGTAIASGTTSEIVCVSPSACLLFKIYDDFGNGLAGTPPGAYSVYYNGSLVDAAINFGTEKTVDLGQCPVGSSCNFPTSLSTTGAYTAPGPESWYVFQPTATGRYSVSTCNLGNTCNTTIWGYDRCDGVIDEQSQQEAVFYSDDACGTQAEVETYFIAGKTYYLRIGDSGVSCEGTAIDWELTYLGAVSGCTDLASCNYNPLATVDDGSCIYPGDPACPDGPDLIVLSDVISNSLQVQNYNNDNQCYINEGCLKGYGQRQILRFTTHIQNIGNTDYFIGQTPANPTDQSDQWEWDECHNHWHYEGYAEYLVFDAAGNRLPVGFKNGFCVIDLECSGGGSASYSCGNQGISHGCGDIYNSGLACQWVDLTEVPDGDYSLVVRVNWDRTPDALGRNEISYENNWAQICFNLSRNNNGNAVVNEITNCPAVTDCLGELQGDAVIDCEGNCNGGRFAGDLDANDLYDINDVLTYFQGILDDNLPLTTCNDISADGEINMLEPAMLMNCVLEENGSSGGGAAPSCVFPYLTINNPDVSATFSIRNTNTIDQYFDIYLQNQSASVLAFNLNLTGVTITSLQSLIPDPAFSMNFGFDATGEIAGLSLIETATPRYSSAEPFVRVYYSSIANEACIADVISVVNDKLELITGQVDPVNCTGANPPPTYCSTQGNNASYEWIQSVAFANINNNSGADGGYKDFSNQVANLSAGNYSIDLEPGFNSNGPYQEHWGVWIDFNVDGDFEDAGEQLLSESANNTVSGNISIPNGTGTINTRMRISMRWNNDPTSCGNFDYGEVEDYGIAIIEVQDQTINFPPLADKLTNDPAFSITATASSGLPVSLSIVSGPASLAGNVLTLDGTPGTVVVRASQGGNTSYNPAVDVEQSFMVSDPPLQDQTIIFGTLANKETTDSPFSISASTSSGLAVSFSIVSGPASITGNTITLDGTEGVVVVRASQGGNAQYNPAPNVERSFNVSAPALLDQSITFAPLADKETTDLPFSLSATASSGLAVSLSIISGPASINGNTITLDGNEGMVVVRASQGGDAQYNPAPDVERSFNVSNPALQDQTITFDPLTDKETTDLPFDLSATASSGLAVSFSIVSGPATLAGNTLSLTGAEGLVLVRASQLGDSQYNPAPAVERSFNVSSPVLQDQTITFDLLTDKETTDLPFDLSATASSGLAVSFNILSGPATLAGNTLSLTGAEGIVTVRASQGGDAQYNPASDVEQSFNVTSTSLLDQTISFVALADRDVMDAPFTLVATASSGLAVSFSILSGPATIIGDEVTLDGTTGTVTIRASQAGDAQYAAAPTVDQSFEVTEDPGTPGVYCSSIGTAPWVEWIDRVTFGTIDNESFKELYGDFTNLSTDVSPGNSYPIDLNPGLSWFGHQTDLYWRVWIDFNQDGDFTDAGELVLEMNNGNQAVSGTVSVPAGASLGNTRMRVSMKKDAYPNACENFAAGEVEDYTVKIVDGTGGPVCENITDGGSIDGEETDCDNYDPTLINSPVLPSGGSGMIQYKWEASTSSSTGPWTNAGGTGITFDPASISQTTWYRRLSRRENCTTYTGISNTVVKTVDNCSNPGVICDAQGTQPWWEWIGEVLFGDIQNATFKDSYGDYTNLSTDLEQGASLPITLSPGLSWAGYQTDLFWRAWIDFNQDGDFTDVGEMVLEANNGSDPVNADIQVPIDAELGSTRLRIAIQRDQYPGSCETFNYGEVEDYSVQIISPTAPPNRAKASLALTLTRKSQNALLEWVTNTESSNAYFIVERAINDEAFKELMRVNSRHETEGFFHYSRQDERLVQGILTYRIKQVYQDGTFTYSEEKQLDLSDLKESLLLFPNPAAKRFWVKFNRYEGETGVLQIHNVYGQLMEERQIDNWTIQGESFDLDQYIDGVYFVSLNLGNYKRLTAQLIVNHLH